jgi:hypothetical protein
MNNPERGPLRQEVNHKHDDYFPESDEPAIGERWYAKIRDTNFPGNAIEVTLLERTKRTVLLVFPTGNNRFKREDVEFLERLKVTD